MSSLSNCERTLILLKPDAVKRGLVGTILQRFEQRGFKLIAAKFMTTSKDVLDKHYHEYTSKSFYPGLVSFMTSGPIMAFVLEGQSIISAIRIMIGDTTPSKSPPGTIRGDFAIDINSNIIHGSDTLKSAEYEIGLWFPELIGTYSHDYL